MKVTINDLKAKSAEFALRRVTLALHATIDNIPSPIPLFMMQHPSLCYVALFPGFPDQYHELCKSRFTPNTLAAL